MMVSLRRSEVDATGKPLYMKWEDVPQGFNTKTQCAKLKKPITDDEEPVAYVLCRYWNGYLPLYERR
jgi:hypothetical protein